MKVIFKNVGHGDTIIFETGKNSIGIIDCRIYNNKNPVIEYIKNQNIKLVDFIILSHPHLDHYSGMFNLIKYCFINNIRIKCFCHTLTNLRYVATKIKNEIDLKKKNIKKDIVDYLNYIDNDVNKLKKLRKMLVYIDYLRNLGWLDTKTININWTLSIGNNYTLKALSPSELETQRFYDEIDKMKDMYYHFTDEVANYLSTVFILSNKTTEGHTLFMSDSVIDTQKRKDLQDYLSNHNFLFFQIPHHGSKAHLWEDLWDKIKYTTNCVGYISAGSHRTYDLPDIEVIQYYNSKGINVKCTNFVNGYKEFYYKYNDSDILVARNLDICSSFADENSSSQDLEFNV